MKNALSGYLTEREEPAWTRWLLLLFVPLAGLYWVAAWGHSNTFNTTHEASRKNDQNVYIKLAQDLKHLDYKVRTPRQRTPGYSYLLSVFYSDKLDPTPELDGDEHYSMRWFHRCRALGIWISVACLIGLFFFFRRFLPRVESAFLVSAIACLLYVFRSGYTQPEVLYWSLKLPLFYLMWRMLVKPTWLLAMTCGLLSATAFMVKAGIQPMLLLFVVSFGFKLAWDWLRERGPFRPYLLRALQGSLVPLLYLAVLSPYFLYSYKQFGKPFYSVYSEYLMWTLPEVQVGDLLYVDRHKTRAIQDARSAFVPITLEDYRRELKRFKKMHDEPYVEPDALPSSSRYLQRQTPEQILARGLQGVERNHKRMNKYYRSSWNFLRMLMFSALVIGIVRWRRVWQLLKEKPYLPFYFLGFFTGYLFLYGWYDALRIGPRLMLGLYPIALFSALMLIHSFTSDLVLPFKGKQILVSRLLNLVFIAMLARYAYKVYTDELYLYFSGA